MFMIDTGVLFPETLETWKRFEDRFGVNIEVDRRAQPRRAVDRGELLRRGEGRRARARADRRRRLDHRHPPRAGADTGGAGQARARRAPRDLEGQPARRLEREGPLDLHLRARPALPSAARSGLRLDRLRAVHAARRRPRGPLGRSGQDRVRDPRERMNPLHLRALPSGDPRGRVDPHLPRGGGRVRAPGAAVQRRQGLDRAAAARREGVPAGRASRSRSCTSTPGTTSPR